MCHHNTFSRGQLQGGWSGEIQLIGNDFCQFYRDFQGHGLGLEAGVQLGREVPKVDAYELAFDSHLADNLTLQVPSVLPS